MRKICVITGTRAEYGLLCRLMKQIKDSPSCHLQIIATNMHLMPEYGNTYKEIENDGFVIDERVFMPKSTDDAFGVIDSMSTEMSGMNSAIKRLSPDLVVLLGDRYEMLVAAIVAMMQRIPIAHLYGGEISEGAIDDSIRHCITKLSNLHFTSTEEYRNRVIQLGESPEHVYYVGSIGVENIAQVPIIAKAELESLLDFEIDENTVLCTYHPVTLGDRTPASEISDFLSALEVFRTLKVLFTMPNSDQGCDSIKEAIINFCTNHSDTCKCFESLGMRRYLSAMKNVAAVIGNSSSGLVEVPSAHIPTLNIGDRQKGRTKGASVIDCKSDRNSIVEGLRKVLSPEFRNFCLKTKNPYEKVGTAEAIFSVISTISLQSLSRKSFYNL